MINIKPRTYNEIMRFAGCMELKKYLPNLTDEMIETMYEFLSLNPMNKVLLTPDLLSFVNAAGKTERATVVDASIGNFSRVVLGTNTFNVVNMTNLGRSSGSGCGSCSGCSSNNNNNNNNG